MDSNTPQSQPLAQPVAPQQPVPATPKTNTTAILAIVFAFLFPLVGFILGLVAKSQIKKRGEGGNGLATAAIIISVVLWLIGLIVGIVFVVAVLSSNTYNTNSNSTSSTTSTTTYQGDEKKAADSAVRFLEGLRDSDFNKSYNQMGPELKKEAGSQTDFASSMKSKNLNLIKSWNITSVSTRTNADGVTEITVKGTVQASAKNGGGTFEFGFYKDTDGSVNMLSYEIQPN